MIEIFNKKGKAGFVIRLIAGFVIVLSMPFLITNSSNPFAIVFFALGNFLMVLGGLLP